MAIQVLIVDGSAALRSALEAPTALADAALPAGRVVGLPPAPIGCDLLLCDIEDPTRELATLSWHGRIDASEPVGSELG